MTVQPNIVCAYSIGNTRIKIADNYCADKTAEDVKSILQGAARKAQRSLSVIRMNEKIKTEDVACGNCADSSDIFHDMPDGCQRGRGECRDCTAS